METRKKHMYLVSQDNWKSPHKNISVIVSKQILAELTDLAASVQYNFKGPFSMFSSSNETYFGHLLHLIIELSQTTDPLFSLSSGNKKARLNEVLLSIQILDKFRALDNTVTPENMEKIYRSLSQLEKNCSETSVFSLWKTLVLFFSALFFPYKFSLFLSPQFNGIIWCFPASAFAAAKPQTSRRVLIRKHE